MNPPRSDVRRAQGQQAGFALLVLLGLIGVGSVGIVLAVQSLVPALAEIPVRTERSLAAAGRAARAAFLATGTFPASLDALAAAGGLDPAGEWRVDPWASPGDLDYRTRVTGVRLRSTGRDRRLGTADDVVADVPAEDLLRARQRGRLRLLRAVLLRSPYCFAAAMGAADQAAMRAAMRDHAAARRAWLTADAATRVTLQTTLTTTASTVAALRSAHTCTPLPPRLIGVGGLMEQLGMPDSRCADGQGRRLVRDPVLGVLATGYDRTGGTDDDM